MDEFEGVLAVVFGNRCAGGLYDVYPDTEIGGKQCI
jgi:hypothetical protein